MNFQNTHRFVTRRILLRVCFITAVLLLFGAQLATAVSSSQKTFASPEEAVQALVKAVTSHDTKALAAIFGPSFNDLVSPDQVQAENELTDFGDNLRRANHLTQKQDRYILETGDDQWPFPIPIVKANNAWKFDTEAGKDELINRRIGRNELDALKTIRAYADAQREYAGKDRDGDQVLEYAQKMISSPNAKDGLYWPIDTGGEISPIGPLIAVAQSEGYIKKVAPQAKRRPFHGYYFKPLTRQGAKAPGGDYDYVINGNMIGGFALVAWPAEYGESGVMTFIINQQGKVYQKDLGPKTDSIAEDMKEFNLDKSWTLSRD